MDIPAGKGPSSSLVVLPRALLKVLDVSLRECELSEFDLRGGVIGPTGLFQLVVFSESLT